MTLSAGTRLGPYEILSPIGAGGMGDVYRARDTRLLREVAVKVLPAELAGDVSRLRRFEKEARAASALNHPNVVTVYDIGRDSGLSYIAMERVEGETLRRHLVGGALPVRKLLSIATQVAEGLARAHQAGIVHRDLKPENVMVTKDGIVKILDFGLAKLTKIDPSDDDHSQQQTDTVTSSGMVVGTTGYMSPEQAAGEAVDFRSDEFSFGSILYEMATGKRAFQGKTGVDTLSAILHDEPDPVGLVNSGLPTALSWIVERCLSKDTDGRYASTLDLARDLANLSAHLSGATSLRDVRRPGWGRRTLILITAISTATACVLGVLLLLERQRLGTGGASGLRFQQVTFEYQSVMRARFAPDGETFVYGAWRDEGADLFMARVSGPGSRSLGFPGVSSVWSISRNGQLAFLLRGDTVGTLAEAALTGGAARELLDNVRMADWSPDGKVLAAVHSVGGRDRLEYPIGRVLHEIPGAPQTVTGSAIGGCRVSPTGKSVAILESGRLTLVDEHGGLTRLPQVGDFEFVAWSPRGDELWFSRIAGGATEIRAVTPGGSSRILASLAGDFQLHDVSRSGRLLLERGSNYTRVFGRMRGDVRERDLSYFAATDPVDLSGDGSRLLFNEIESYGTNSTVYLREGTKPPVLIGRGYAQALSPDGKWALATPAGEGYAAEFLLLPTGVGTPRRLPLSGLENLAEANWLPDGRRIVFAANAVGRGARLYVQDVLGGAPRAITPEGVIGLGRSTLVSPDGGLVVTTDGRRNVLLYPVGGGEPHTVQGLEMTERILQWTDDGRLFTKNGLRISILDPESGARNLLMELPSITSSLPFTDVILSRDGKSYVRQTSLYLSNLFVLDGVH